MKIGIAGPVSIRPLVPFLNAPPEAVPEALTGTPISLLVQGLLAAGHRVSVYTLARRATSPLTFSGEQLTIFIGPYREYHRMRNFMRHEREAVQQLIEHDAPDIVHAHWTYEFALGALRSGCPTLITVHDWAPTILRHSPDLYRVGRLLMNIATLSKGRHFVANSPYIQQKFARYLRRTVPVIPNAIDDGRFMQPKHRPSSEPVIVSVNNGFGHRKNVQVLLRAFPHIRAKVPGCRLRLIGDGFELGGPAHQWATENRLASFVAFEGPLPYESVLHALRAADLLVHPALEESFGMTLVEAMASGTPVVAGVESGAVPWVLDHGSAGMLTDVTAPHAVVETACQLLNSHERWQHFSAAGFSHAWTHFRLSQAVDRYSDLYRKLAKGRPVYSHSIPKAA